MHHIDTKVLTSAIEKIYCNKGFFNPLVVTLGEYRLWIYRKQFLNVYNYYTCGMLSLYACGSLVYKKFGYENSLKALLTDYLKNGVNPSELIGNYVIIFHNRVNDKIEILIDPAFVKNVYYCEKHKIISSDFLAIIGSLDQIFTINRDAVIENIITGHLISPDTYVNEINKIDKINVKTLSSKFKGIIFYALVPEIVNVHTSKNEALEHAIHTLNTYFQKVSNLCEDFGANIGLTGGLDSRLLLMVGQKYIRSLITNSFWRPLSKDFINAKELARVAEKIFFSYEEASFQEPDKTTMLKKSFYFFDGQFRSQNRWDEIFSLAEYNRGLAQGHYVGFHGCGGEQYRNAERLIGTISFHDYLLYHWMFKQCNDPFFDKKLKWMVLHNIEQKITRLLEFSGSRVDLFLLKRIQNEIWNSANRTTRLNLLNQQQFYFAPFTEYVVSHSAYNYMPFIGNSFSFQIDMMRRLDLKLAYVKTNYGFNLVDGEPLNHLLYPYLVRLIPSQLLNSLYFKLKERRILYYSIGNDKLKENPFLEDVSKKINFTKVLKNVNLSSGIISMDYFLMELKNKIQI